MTTTGTIEHGRIVLAAPLDLPDGMAVEVSLRPLGGFWEKPSLEELARRQDISAPTSPADVAGDWPEEDSLDEFLAQVREGRA